MWEIKQLRRIISALLKKTGPVTITTESLGKADGEWRVVEDGYGKQQGHKYYVSK
jgi:hypothetical protein